MKKRTVVSGDNLPIRLPIGTAWLTALSQSTWNAPGWVWGVAWTIVVLVAIVAAVDIFTRESKNVF